MAISNSTLRALCLKNVIKPLDFLLIKKRRKAFQTHFKLNRVFQLENYDDWECQKFFRFTKTQLKRLAKALNVPVTCKLRNGIMFSGLEGLCIILRRLCYPNRLCELVDMFQKDVTALSRIANFMTRFIALRYGHLIQKFDEKWNSVENLKQFSNKIHAAGSVYTNLIGFIDGTARPICRPKYNQKVQYSGYKKLHVLKYQSIVTPNGLIAILDGPFNGHRHDSAVLNLSKLLVRQERKLSLPDGSNFAFYGDTGYANQKFIKVGYKNYVKLSKKQRQFNTDMSALRVHVEYGFGKIIQLFAFLDFKKNQKLLLQPIKLQYITAAILTNCHTCMNGCQVSDYFCCSPPSLENYLNDL